MAGSKTLVLILSCEKTRDRREACLETWLKHVPEGVEWRFVVGRPGQPNWDSGTELFLDCPDSYLGLPVKVWAMYREALVRFDFDWLCKVDDDTFANLGRVKAYPSHWGEHGQRHYMGRRIVPSRGGDTWHRDVLPGKELVGPVPDFGIPASGGEMCRLAEGVDQLAGASNVWHTWAGGMAYWLSRTAVRLVAQEPLRHVERELYEDKFVGAVMAGWGITLHGQHQTLRHGGESVFGATAIHPCLPNRMRELYWRLLRAGEMET